MFHLKFSFNYFFSSEILYPKEATSPHSGVSAEHICKGRDYVVGLKRFH